MSQMTERLLQGTLLAVFCFVAYLGAERTVLAVLNAQRNQARCELMLKTEMAKPGGPVGPAKPAGPGG